MSVIDSQRWQRASPYLDDVLELAPPDREASLAALRAQDPQIAADVEALLAEHRLLSAKGFLDTPVATTALPAVPLTGVAVGAYTLVSPIGQGGMGSVWLAERNDGRFEGRVAVKLLNTALIGRGGEERFRREGTILAKLTHPHIARLIDAGVSATGQPFLVLEHVAGRHIDRYCDEQRLAVEERIRLFLDVQAAVAHAHASLIVHRDLKPSNVLVDETGQVKLLDFGIAKLLERDSPDEVSTMLTREGDAALTPKYAAPEQVTGGRVTTATDVYALGVLLFELLTGQHPTGVAARSAAEFVRAVAQTDPLRLSDAVAGGSALNAVAARAGARSTTPERLRRVLRGDLDTIVAKALKTDPAERYESVAEFADDLRRYLNHQPISARPDTLRYRSVKFVRRHRSALTAAALGVAGLAMLIGFYTVRLTTERDRARVQADKASRISELLTGILTGVDPYRTPDAKEPTVQNLLDRGAARVDAELSDQPEVQAEMLTVIGRTYERMGLEEKALPLLERALAIGRKALGPEHVRIAQSLNDLGVLHRERGNVREAEPLLRESLGMRRKLLGSQNKDVAVTLVELARALVDQGRSDAAEPLVREALAIRRAVFGEEHRETATSKNELGQLLLRRGDVAGAERLLRENVATNLHLLGPGHPNTSASKSTLASALLARGETTEAEALLREAVAADRAVFGDQHPTYAQKLAGLAIAIELEGGLAEAQRLLEESLRISRPRLGPAHWRVLNYTINLCRVRIERGDAAATEPALRDVLAARERAYPAGDWRIAQAQSLLAASLMAQQRYADAESLMLTADAVLKPIAGPQGRERNANRTRLAALYRATSRAQLAATLR